MYTFPNQKRVIIGTDNNDPENVTVILNKNHWALASRYLSPSAFKVYIYFALNRSGFEFALSRSDVCDKTGISDGSYSRAIQELMEKRYLTPLGGNKYLFSSINQKPKGWINES